MRTTKRQPFFFSFYDVDGIERHLEQMAERGWFLETAGSFLWTYRRGGPKALHYSLIYYPKASAFEPEKSDGQQTFEEFCDHAGWKTVASNAQLLVFANEREDPVPIHTDPEVELESIEAMSRRVVWSWYVLIVLCLLHILTDLSFFGRDVIGFLSSPTRLFNAPLFPLLFLYFLAEAVTWHRWKRKARAAAEQGEFLPTHGHHYLLLAILAIFVLGTVGLAVYARGSSTAVMALLLVAGYGLLFSAVSATRKLMQRKKASREKNMAVTLVVDVVLALALMGFTTGLILHQAPTFTGPEEPPLVLEDLIDETSPETEVFSREEGTFLVRHTYYSEYPDPDATERGRYVNYDLTDVHAAFLFDACLDQYLRRYEDWGDYQEDYDPEHPFYIWEAVDPALFGADQAWQLTSYDISLPKYLLVRGSRIVELETSWTPSEEHLSIAGGAFFPSN